MYAVIETGGKQYRVAPGDVIQIEKMEGEVGTAIKFDKVLFMSKGNPEAAQIWMGKPYLSGAQVQSEVVGQGRGDKILIIKMKRRKQYRRTQGHRQFYTQILITGVDNGSGEKAALSAEEKKTKLDTFQSHLTPKGEAFTAPIIKRRVDAKYMVKADAPKKEASDAAPKKAAASAGAAKKKTSTDGAKKTASKAKTTSKKKS